MNNLALKVAWEAHKDQKRKGTDIPYIVHPIEVAVILLNNDAGEDLIAAGLLHDTLEDTGVTLDEIREKFGENIARLVVGASEPDKIGTAGKLSNQEEKKSWRERKQHTIEYLAEAPKDVKLIACADKLSNIRSMFNDYEEIGNCLWKRFNASCAEQKWYYEGLVKSLEGISEYKMYQELADKVKEQFGSRKVTDFINKSKEGVQLDEK